MAWFPSCRQRCIRTCPGWAVAENQGYFPGRCPRQVPGHWRIERHAGPRFAVVLAFVLPGWPALSPSSSPRRPRIRRLSPSSRPGILIQLSPSSSSSHPDWPALLPSYPRIPIGGARRRPRPLPSLTGRRSPSSLAGLPRWLRRWGSASSSIDPDPKGQLRRIRGALSPGCPSEPEVGWTKGREDLPQHPLISAASRGSLPAVTVSRHQLLRLRLWCGGSSSRG
jgi:hypothetical protein